ncbi:hypothetical protein H6P81_013345 [Aristolochia fimbriata]|uniref:Uncharacterized protein n=1 Tax=Aristolochia fimbriata TaxID=158543 RepID=A0AAV7EEF8_ARIFI|nr:hypothetical protein H6P81_013345 [Aristolochia fimbriata]
MTLKVYSFEADVLVPELAAKEGSPETFCGVFIRSPAILEAGPDVEILADLSVPSDKSTKFVAQNPEEKSETLEKVIIAVKQGNLLGTIFHPELTADTRWFCEIFGEAATNITGLGDQRFMEDWNKRRILGRETNNSSNERGRIFEV